MRQKRWAKLEYLVLLFAIRNFSCPCIHQFTILNWIHICTTLFADPSGCPV